MANSTEIHKTLNCSYSYVHTIYVLYFSLYEENYFKIHNCEQKCFDNDYLFLHSQVKNTFLYDLT